MHSRGQFGWLMGVGGVFAALLFLSSAASAQQRDDARDLEEMLGRVNEMRAATGLRPLMRDGRLDAAARAHSEDMADHDMLAHVSPRTGDPAARVAAEGVAVNRLAENISVNTEVLTCHEGLVASEGHRANLLNPVFNHIGLAASRGSRGVYVTQVFASITDAVADQPVAPSAATAPLAASAQSAVDVGAQGEPVVRVPPNGTRRVNGYWVQSAGRWWYYPLPADARPGQALTPSNVQPAMSQASVAVQPAPYSYVAPAQQSYVYGAPPYYQQQVYAQPAQPVYVQPAQPVYVQPTQRIYVQPAQPVYVAPPPFGWSPRRHYNRWR